MKTIAKTVMIVLGVAALAACNSKGPETTASESPEATEAALPAPETPAQPADEIVTKPDTGVDVKLPDVPVTTETVTPAPGADKPATGR